MRLTNDQISMLALEYVKARPDFSMKSLTELAELYSNVIEEMTPAKEPVSVKTFKEGL